MNDVDRYVREQGDVGKLVLLLTAQALDTESQRWVNAWSDRDDRINAGVLAAQEKSEDRALVRRSVAAAEAQAASAADAVREAARARRDARIGIVIAFAAFVLSASQFMWPPGR
ncbi:MAG: hypothetical protein J0H69_19680 [Burkholderiales bacterium]|nr:hypothetical protein [Burkholderiales bacterium]